MVKIAEISKFVSMALSAHNIDESHVTGVRWGWRYECGKIVVIDLDATAPIRCLPNVTTMPFTSMGQALIAYEAPAIISGVYLSSHEPMALPVDHTEESAKTTSGVTP
jgi:hypothetical protein